MKTIQIEIPDGKKAEWVNGVLTLVDDKPTEYKFKVGDKVELSIPPYGIHEIKGIAEGVPTPHYKLSDEGNQYYQEDVLTVAQDITDRIKTFEDACKWCRENNRVKLFEEHKLVNDFWCKPTPDILAYLKLRIITCALNEGWEPTFEDGKALWYVGYYIENGTYVSDYSCIWVTTPNRLMFKSARLAEYAAKQFRDIYADFCGCKKGGEQ